MDYLNQTYGVTVMPQGKSPRNRPSDLLDQAPHKFTKEKQFQPRILRTHTNAQSKLTGSKDYNPPPKRRPAQGENVSLTKEAIERNQKVQTL